ncbi:MAG: RnfABCDGE type electron transport complex subunit D [Candidatus Bipolaricaulia bacterium]
MADQERSRAIEERLERLFENLNNRVESDERLKKLTPLVKGAEGFLFGGTELVADTFPYLRDNIGMQRFMSMPIIGLMLPTLAGIYFFGWRALAIVAVSYTVGGLTEMIFSYVRGEDITEGLLVTGILFPLTLPPTTPLWMVALGIIVGVAMGKEIFGGTGNNIFNPALVGRAFLLISFPVEMTTRWAEPMVGGVAGFGTYAISSDAISRATPLINFKATAETFPLREMFLGNISGSIGETSALLLLLGGILLIVTKIIDWRVPLSYIGTVGLLAWGLNILTPERFAPPLFQMLAGGVFLAAFFMLTDPVTHPMLSRGKWIFGIGCGVLTVLIRALTGFAEGVLFAVLLMNMFTPLIDLLTLPKGYRREAV